MSRPATPAEAPARRRAAIVVAVALAIALTSVLAALALIDEPSEESSGGVLFRGDFETGDLSQWGPVQAEASDRVTVGADGPEPLEGRFHGRFEVRPGDTGGEAGGNRAEVTPPKEVPRFEEGDERWIRDSVYVPRQTLDTPWRQVVQYSANGEGSPAVALFLDTDGESRPRLELRHGDSSTKDWVGPTLAFDRWYEISVHLNYSSDPSAGFVEVYLDGKKQTLTNGQTRRYRATMEHGEAYLKVGIYRDPSHDSTDVVFHDDVVISATGQR
jgi:Polysaccharide lyase